MEIKFHKFQIGDLVRPSSLHLLFHSNLKIDSDGRHAFVGTVVAIENSKQRLPYYRILIDKKVELIPEEELSFPEEIN